MGANLTHFQAEILQNVQTGVFGEELHESMG